MSIKVTIFKENPSQEPIIESPTIPPKYEEVFSTSNYMKLAVVIGALAAVLFPICFPASMALAAGATWFLFSALVVVINRAIDENHLKSKSLHQLHAFINEINAIGLATLSFPFTFFQKCHGPHGDEKGRPILFVNGYLSFGSTWYYQRQKLIEAGFGPIYSMNVGSWRSIDTYAEQVKEKALEIQKETRRNDLILIGHSKGGLVSSRFTTDMADSIRSEVTDVITIGSPLAGTPLAYIGPGQDAYEMRPDSEFNQALREKIKGHTPTRFYHIASETDAVVPLSSALLGDEKEKQFVLKDMGHLGLVYSSRVAHQIHTWLEKSPDPSAAPLKDPEIPTPS